jgi:hypothetical protein
MGRDIERFLSLKLVRIDICLPVNSPGLNMNKEIGRINIYL